ncbi:hypothetical protein J7E96_08580 [Streptomyces sp. ISL-96]|uniref:hypothetical protein n=1 Tax=Streptomyces sp. ISL-96 TaxID=2819191 RepID=UPI001BECA36D|nr:hypothetical protein [Streptomyces sp. ISL-96]MBT2488578.1 hypothetical protein [Streptomyces sp. ISL-96]
MPAGLEGVVVDTHFTEARRVGPQLDERGLDAGWRGAVFAARIVSDAARAASAGTAAAGLGAPPAGGHGRDRRTAIPPYRHTVVQGVAASGARPEVHGRVERRHSRQGDGGRALEVSGGRARERPDAQPALATACGPL